MKVEVWAIFVVPDTGRDDFKKIREESGDWGGSVFVQISNFCHNLIFIFQFLQFAQPIACCSVLKIYRLHLFLQKCANVFQFCVAELLRQF